MIGFYVLDFTHQHQERVFFTLLLKDGARKILSRDGTHLMMTTRINHIIGRSSYLGRRNHPNNITKIQRGKYAVHQYYDQVADMVIREFPALAPYVVRKRASHVIDFKTIDEATMPATLELVYHVIHQRKYFKYQTWYFMTHGERI